MSFNYISKISIYLSFLFIFSCQSELLSLNKNNEKNIIPSNQEDNNQIKVDLNFDEIKENNVIDYYTDVSVIYQFNEETAAKLKINNYEGKIVNFHPINIIYLENIIYSINSKGEILKFNSETGYLIERLILNTSIVNKTPVSFSLVNNNFIIGFKSGEILKVNPDGSIKWFVKIKNFLNTPLKIFNGYIYILFPDDFVAISLESGEIMYEINFSKNNIIQSTGGQIVNFFNKLYFILPNSEFHTIDTFLFKETFTELNNIKLKTSLNNLNDKIYIYKDLFVYIDNGNTLNTYDILNNKFLVSDMYLNEIGSTYLFNKYLISKNDDSITFYNIENGKLIKNINIKQIIKKKTNIVKIMPFENRLQVFFDNGSILNLDTNLNILDKFDLNIKGIIKIFNYQGKIFISTDRGFTYIL
tara:strand:- start:350 stop:1594 length:1245 start_codon:yes stop_codon:yes gene_type:complete